MKSSIKSCLISLYKELSEITEPKCRFSCRVPISCCSVEYCELTRSIAKDHWGVELKETGHPKLPFMGKDGCTVEPHLRPLCTLHVCSINSMGFDKDNKFNKQYFKLRQEINDLEFKLFHNRDENNIL